VVSDVDWEEEEEVEVREEELGEGEEEGDVFVSEGEDWLSGPCSEYWSLLPGGKEKLKDVNIGFVRSTGKGGQTSLILNLL
jgi:hypothetical protein